MDRKKTTEFLGNLLVSDKFGGIGKYWASEVSIDPWAACEFPYKSRVMPTSEPLKTLKAPYMARNTMKWGFFRLKSQ